MTLISDFRRGFTLIELLVVISMIAIIMGALTTSISSARERARIQKTNAEVKAVTQAILGFESWENGEFEKFESEKDIDSESLGFLLGRGGNAAAAEGGQSAKIPVLLMAALKSGGKMLDPWGTPYKVRIHKGTIDAAARVDLYTSFMLPNYYRLTPEEM